MFRHILVLFVVVSLAILSGCSDENITNTQAGDLFQISYGQMVRVEGEDIVIGFSGAVYDSRCPLSAFCVWPGQAEIEIWMRNSAGDTLRSNAILWAGGGENSNLDKPARFPCYEVELEMLLPYPESPGAIPEEDYIASLRVNKVSCEPSEPVIQPVYLTWMTAQEIQIDQFDLDSAYFSGDTLILDVFYSGGCLPHDFDLYMSPPVFMESYPVQASLYLRHRAYDDPCDAYLSQELRFSVSSVVGLYYSMYGSLDPIVFNIYDYFEGEPTDIISVTYDPSD